MPIFTGSDFARAIRLVDRSSGQPVDLTGFEFELCIKRQTKDAVALAELSMGNGLAVPDPSDGRVLMTLTAAQTTEIGAGGRVWALYRTDGGRRLPLASGKMIVRKGI